MIRRTREATGSCRSFFHHQWRRRIYISFILVGTSCTGGRVRGPAKRASPGEAPPVSVKRTEER